MISSVMLRYFRARTPPSLHSARQMISAASSSVRNIEWYLMPPVLPGPRFQYFSSRGVRPACPRAVWSMARAILDDLSLRNDTG